MSNKTNELINVLKENPDRKLIFMYPEENSEHPYTLGYPSKIFTDEYTIDDDRVWLKYEDEDELFDSIANKVFDEIYPHKTYATEEDEVIIKKITDKRISELNWEKAIVVYINP